jgi:hypothetical protein
MVGFLASAWHVENAMIDSVVAARYSVNFIVESLGGLLVRMYYEYKNSHKKFLSTH